MNTEFDVLARLGELSEADRSWILSKLPANSRKRLLALGPKENEARPQALLQTGDATSLSDVCEDVEEIRVLRRAESSVLVEFLRNQPAYLVAGLLLSHNWSWRDELLQALPHLQRAEIANLLDTMRLTPEMSTSLVKLAARRLGQISPTTQTRSRFESLVQRIAASRSRKRSTHL